MLTYINEGVELFTQLPHFLATLTVASCKPTLMGMKKFCCFCQHFWIFLLKKVWVSVSSSFYFSVAAAYANWMLVYIHNDNKSLATWKFFCPVERFLNFLPLDFLWSFCWFFLYPILETLLSILEFQLMIGWYFVKFSSITQLQFDSLLHWVTCIN